MDKTVHDVLNECARNESVNVDTDVNEKECTIL